MKEWRRELERASRDRWSVEMKRGLFDASRSRSTYRRWSVRRHGPGRRRKDQSRAEEVSTELTQGWMARRYWQRANGSQLLYHSLKRKRAAAPTGTGLRGFVRYSALAWDIDTRTGDRARMNARRQPETRSLPAAVHCTGILVGRRRAEMGPRREEGTCG